LRIPAARFRPHSRNSGIACTPGVEDDQREHRGRDMCQQPDVDGLSAPVASAAGVCALRAVGCEATLAELTAGGMTSMFAFTARQAAGATG
jgi:hypothetical protein